MSPKKRDATPPTGERGDLPVGGWSYEEARGFRLRMSLRTTPVERLRDLEAMIDFNATVEARNPRVKRVAEALRRDDEGRARRRRK